MNIIVETTLENFEAWSGGEDTLDTLRDKDLCERLEYILENDIFPDGCTDTDVNDFLWFERDYIAELLGFRNWEALEDGDEDEDDDDEDRYDMELLEEHIQEKYDFNFYCDIAECDGRCPFSRCKTMADCKRAYNLMLDGNTYEEAMEKVDKK